MATDNLKSDNPKTEQASSNTAPEKMEFKAEVKQLLQLMIH